MKFTEQKIETINNNLSEKKKANPISRIQTGIGVNLQNSLDGAAIFKDNWHICNLEDLNRMIEELTMLKEVIEEETGMIL